MASWDNDPAAKAAPPWEADPVASGGGNPPPEDTGPDGPVQTSQTLGFEQGAKTPLDNAAYWLESGLKKLGVPTDKINHFFGTPSAAEAKQATQKDVEDAAKKGIRPGTTGNVLGSILSTLPLTLLTKNPWMLGAGGGALETNSDNLAGTASDAVVGGLTGKAGDTAMRTLGAVAAPVYRPAVNAMLKAGVRLTPGQIMGGTLHRAEDVSTSVLGVGDLVKGAQDRAMEDFNRVAANRTLEPLRIKLKPTVEAGHDSVAAAQDMLNHAYDTIVPNASFKVDKRLVVGVTRLHQLTRGLSDDGVKRFDNMLNDEVGKRLSANGTMTGTAFKRVDETLGREARKFRAGNASPNDREYSDAIRQLQSELRDNLGRANPRIRARLSAIDEGWSNLTRVEDAAQGTNKGVFTPEKLRQATTRQDISVRHRASARGEARMQDLAKTGSDTVSRTIGETGSGTRAAVNALVGLAITGGHLAINPTALGVIGALGGMYTKRGGAIMRAAMTKRPAGMAAVRKLIEQGRPGATVAATRLLPSSPSDSGDQ